LGVGGCTWPSKERLSRPGEKSWGGRPLGFRHHKKKKKGNIIKTPRPTVQEKGPFPQEKKWKKNSKKEQK